MYTRAYEWQAPTITSQSESGWVNIVTLGFPCIDIRMKLRGYGWKSDPDVENEVVLELKAVETINKIFEAQLLTYLKALEKKLDLLSILTLKCSEMVLED